ncbi:MAG: hypothetical protein IEMM0002_0171 [bacterium]|nr:MAG: hypothetical protein IEMM0002_0171 [bacterium]
MKSKERSRQTISKIINAAYGVISECSISGTTTGRIAQRALVSKPLLYYHFKTKSALLARVLEYVLERLLDIPRENVTKNLASMEELKAVFQSYKKTLTAEPALLVVFYDFWVHGVKHPHIREKIVNRFEVFRKYLFQIVSEGVERGEFSPEKSHMVPPVMLSLLEGASLQLITDPDAFNFDLYQFIALDMISAITATQT